MTTCRLHNLTLVRDDVRSLLARRYDDALRHALGTVMTATAYPAAQDQRCTCLGPDWRQNHCVPGNGISSGCNRVCSVTPSTLVDNCLKRSHRDAHLHHEACELADALQQAAAADGYNCLLTDRGLVFSFDCRDGLPRGASSMPLLSHNRPAQNDTSNWALLDLRKRLTRPARGALKAGMRTPWPLKRDVAWWRGSPSDSALMHCNSRVSLVARWQNASGMDVAFSSPLQQLPSYQSKQAVSCLDSLGALRVAPHLSKEEYTAALVRAWVGNLAPTAHTLKRLRLPANSHALTCTCASATHPLGLRMRTPRCLRAGWASLPVFHPGQY